MSMSAAAAWNYLSIIEPGEGSVATVQKLLAIQPRSSVREASRNNATTPESLKTHEPWRCNVVEAAAAAAAALEWNPQTRAFPPFFSFAVSKLNNVFKNRFSVKTSRERIFDFTTKSSQKN